MDDELKVVEEGAVDGDPRVEDYTIARLGSDGQWHEVTTFSGDRELAYLFAAAPDLLRGCRLLLEVLTLGTLEAAAKYGPDYDREAADREAAECALGAIAKAEGSDG